MTRPTAIPERSTWRVEYRDANTGNAWRDWGCPLMTERGCRAMVKHRETVSAQLAAPFVFRAYDTAAARVEA